MWRHRLSKSLWQGLPPINKRGLLVQEDLESLPLPECLNLLFLFREKDCLRDLKALTKQYGPIHTIIRKPILPHLQ